MSIKGRWIQAARVAAIVTAVACVIPGSAFAADPSASGNKPIASTGDTTQLGYSKEQANAKLQQLAAMNTRTKISRIAPQTIDPGEDPTSDRLPGWQTLHQKTNSWCLSAIVENILWYKFGSHYIEGGTYSWQYYIDSIVQKQESKALPYINAQIKANGSTFYYVVNTPASRSAFVNSIRFDVTGYRYPTYTAVDVTSPAYAWHQRTAARHATAAVGYGGNGTTVDIADPFTSPSYSPGCSLGVHVGYSSSPTYGCTYLAYPMADFYQSLSFPNPTWF